MPRLISFSRSLATEAEEDDEETGSTVKVWRRPPRNDPNHFPGQNEYVYIARILTLFAFAFMSGWGAEFSFRTFGVFTSSLTGNLTLAARSLVSNNLSTSDFLFYTSVIGSNLLGAYTFSFVRVFTPWAATLATPIAITLLMVSGYGMYRGTYGNWMACLSAPVFGAINVLITYGPVAVTPTFATASLQKLAQFPPKRFAQRYKRKDYAESLLLVTAVCGLFLGVLFSGLFLYYINLDQKWVCLTMSIVFAVLMPGHDVLFYYVLVNYLPADALPEEHLRHKIFRWCGETEYYEDEDEDEVPTEPGEEQESRIPYFRFDGTGTDEHAEVELHSVSEIERNNKLEKDRDAAPSPH